MKKQMSSEKLVALIFGALVLCFAAVSVVSAWTAPTAAPPGNNVPAPLNIGAVGQAKIAGLELNTGGASMGLLVDNGCVGVDTSCLDGNGNLIATLDVNGTAQMTGFRLLTTGVIKSGYVLTSDANGNGTWKPAAAGGTTTGVSGINVSCSPGRAIQSIDQSGNVVCVDVVTPAFLQSYSSTSTSQGGCSASAGPQGPPGLQGPQAPTTQP